MDGDPICAQLMEQFGRLRHLTDDDAQEVTQAIIQLYDDPTTIQSLLYLLFNGDLFIKQNATIFLQKSLIANEQDLSDEDYHNIGTQIIENFSSLEQEIQDMLYNVLIFITQHTDLTENFIEFFNNAFSNGSYYIACYLGMFALRKIPSEVVLEAIKNTFSQPIRNLQNFLFVLSYYHYLVDIRSQIQELTAQKFIVSLTEPNSNEVNIFCNAIESSFQKQVQLVRLHDVLEPILSVLQQTSDNQIKYNLLNTLFCLFVMNGENDLTEEDIISIIGIVINSSLELYVEGQTISDTYMNGGEDILSELLKCLPIDSATEVVACLKDELQSAGEIPQYCMETILLHCSMERDPSIIMSFDADETFEIIIHFILSDDQLLIGFAVSLLDSYLYTAAHMSIYYSSELLMSSTSAILEKFIESPNVVLLSALTNIVGCIENTDEIAEELCGHILSLVGQVDDQCNEFLISLYGCVLGQARSFYDTSSIVETFEELIGSGDLYIIEGVISAAINLLRVKMQMFKDCPEILLQLIEIAVSDVSLLNSGVTLMMKMIPEYSEQIAAVAKDLAQAMMDIIHDDMESTKSVTSFLNGMALLISLDDVVSQQNIGNFCGLCLKFIQSDNTELVTSAATLTRELFRRYRIRSKNFAFHIVQAIYRNSEYEPIVELSRALAAVIAFNQNPTQIAALPGIVFGKLDQLKLPNIDEFSRAPEMYGALGNLIRFSIVSLGVSKPNVGDILAPHLNYIFSLVGYKNVDVFVYMVLSICLSLNIVPEENAVHFATVALESLKEDNASNAVTASYIFDTVSRFASAETLLEPLMSIYAEKNETMMRGVAEPIIASLCFFASNNPECIPIEMHAIIFIKLPFEVYPNYQIVGLNYLSACWPIMSKELLPIFFRSMVSSTFFAQQTIPSEVVGRFLDALHTVSDKIGEWESNVSAALLGKEEIIQRFHSIHQQLIEMQSQ